MIKKPLPALRAITLAITAAVLMMWLAGMYCLTAVTAEFAAKRYLLENRSRASNIATMSFHNLNSGAADKYKNFRESRLWDAANTGHFSSLHDPVVKGDPYFFLSRRRAEEIYVENAIFDRDGNMLVSSFDDYFAFEYMSEEQWETRQERTGDWARACYIPYYLTEAGKALVEKGSNRVDAAAMRFTGSFNGIELTPTKIEFISEDDFRKALHKKGSGTYTISGVVQSYDLEWIVAYEDPGAVPVGTEEVVLYTDWIESSSRIPSPDFNHDGCHYGGLDAFLTAVGPELAQGDQILHRYEGLDLLIVSTSYNMNHGDLNYDSSSYHGPEAYAEKAPEVQFYIVSAVWCSPWRTAFGELRNVYLATLLVAGALITWLRSLARQHLTKPLKTYTEAMAGPWPDLPRDHSIPLKEVRDLQDGYSAVRDTLRIRQNEINRLRTSLDYAQKAEENRRQLTSHIAHELKTPLAVVHSYAEGLSEHIAEEKRDRYIQVILSETERMDAMVLELLDLSRLEAGKVTLARDAVSLDALAREVMERFIPQSEEKRLQVDFAVESAAPITADRARLEQVITNFAANAVKYTPVGGRMYLRIRRVGSRQEFIIGNDCAPLPNDALEHIWDSFYQADNARRDSGVGLGLAIARSIIDLHGGQRIARNTASGVEFGFQLPL